MTTPFITPEDEQAAFSRDPIAVGQHKINQLHIEFTMTDAEIDALAEEAKQIRNTYTAWAEFKSDLTLRKARLMGFQSALTQLDLQTAATQLGTTTVALQTFLGGYITQETARVTELQAYWDSGTLPSPTGNVLNQAPPTGVESDPALIEDILNL
jgi:hypothetical protein